MAVLSYPGVYVKELPSGVRTITGVATSITAFVGRALRGPVDKAVTITSYADFERTYGGLWIDSRLGYAVRDFYQQGGGVAVIVRVHTPSATDRATITFGTTDKLVLTARAPGTPGDTLTAKIDVPTTLQAGEFRLTVTDTASGITEVFSPVTVAGTTAVLTKVNAGSNLVTVTTAPTTVPASATGVVAPSTESATIDLGSGASLLRLRASSPGAWGVKLKATVDKDVPTLSATSVFNLTVTDTGSGRVEIFRNVSYDPGHPRRVDIVVGNESQLVTVAVLPTAAQSGTAAVPGSPATGTGTDGARLTAAAITTGSNMRANKKGLYALEDVDIVNLVVVPPYTATDDVGGPVLTDTIAYATERRAIVIIDADSSFTTVDAAVAGASATSFTHSSNAAFYFPRIRKPDPLRDGQIDTFPPSGAVAGVIARTDATRGVWKAPAGLDAKIDGVAELSVSLTDLEIGRLNPLGVNCLRAAPGAGHVVWGARTRDGDDRAASEWKYLPVRRTALFLEESLYRGTQWVVFEPNDAPLWAQIRLNIGAFMSVLFRQGAFAGTTPREAYFVKCDTETTTQADVNAGIVNVIVGFAPLKPAEFVVVSLQQMAGQTGGA